MGAQDKLVPAAGVIANNLYGTKFSTKSTFRMTPDVKTKYANPVIDAVNFLGSIHAKQLRIADNNAIWNGTLANNPPRSGGLSDQVLSQYVLDKGIHDEVLPGFAATTIEEWNELQTGISRAYNIINTLGLTNPPYNNSELNDGLDQMGIFSTNQILTDAIGNPLPGSGTLAIWEAYADAWNEYKVPADAALGFDTPYIAPILPSRFLIAPAPGSRAYYRITGKSRWAFPFTGWNLTK
jgi:hypothetical protein